MPSSIGDLALERIVGHRVDGFDDVRVILDRVVNQRGAAGFLLAQELLQSEPFAAWRTWTYSFSRRLGSCASRT